jgi:hypothetical protein
MRVLQLILLASPFSSEGEYDKTDFKGHPTLTHQYFNRGYTYEWKALKKIRQFYYYFMLILSLDSLENFHDRRSLFLLFHWEYLLIGFHWKNL